jgi:hypothetical protein
VDPLVNPPNIVVDDIQDITLEPGVGPHKVTNTSAPKVVHINPSSPKVARPSKLIEGNSNSDHALIGQYLLHPKPLMFDVDVKSKLEIVMAISMNCF